MILAISAGFILQAGATLSFNTVTDVQSPDPSPPADDTCLDYPQHWVDNEGRSCVLYYQRQWCTAEGGYGPGWGSLSSATFTSYAHDGHTAAGACCACGGGVRGEMLDILRQAVGTEEPAAPKAPAANASDASGADAGAIPKARETVATTSSTTMTTTTTFHVEVRSELHCFTEDSSSMNSFGSWGQPSAPDGTDCHFPFSWHDVAHTECTSTDYDRMWCYVGPDPADGWGNCKCEELRYELQNQCRTTARALGTTALSGTDCYFPFEFEGLNYTECTTAGRGEGGIPWCAVGPTVDGGWGNCACEANWVDVSASTANVCLDMIVSYPDLDAWGDDCSYYVGREDECGQSDSLLFRAGELCCACGGGSRLDHTYNIGDIVLVKNEAEEPWTTMSVSRMIPTRVVPLGSPEGTEHQTFNFLQPCNDDSEWRDDVFGEGVTSCEDLAKENEFGSPQEWCTAYGEASQVVRLRCPTVCGTCLEVRGGVTSEPADSAPLDEGQLSCTDIDGGEVDGDGDNCDDYQRYPHSCGCCDHPGRFVAAELCCACGGGGTRMMVA